MPTTRREAHELLLIEEADAWFEYLAATRSQSAVRYKEVETVGLGAAQPTPEGDQDEAPEAQASARG